MNNERRKVKAYMYSSGHIWYRTVEGLEFRVPARKVYHVNISDYEDKFLDYIPQTILLME